MPNKPTLDSLEKRIAVLEKEQATTKKQITALRYPPALNTPRVRALFREIEDFLKSAKEQ